MAAKHLSDHTDIDTAESTVSVGKSMMASNSVERGGDEIGDHASTTSEHSAFSARAVDSDPNQAYEPLNEFHLFSKLPAEVRQGIWELSLPASPQYAIIVDQDPTHASGRFTLPGIVCHIPAALQCNHESRESALRRMTTTTFETPNGFMEFRWRFVPLSTSLSGPGHDPNKFIDNSRVMKCLKESMKHITLAIGTTKYKPVDFLGFRAIETLIFNGTSNWGDT
ncbi:hypothetical protein BJ875DRAFT_444233 [Amylocarpus encephaloides]|uniref:2EXR domain-containing protein n=1 Tax=Amylocarpus encephaloides TaxID=45428 RepID=A0A9P7YDM7_9HELO|nr:hypothetical protein BJ875DRAFT_444233 [Amylocarpus encephaloides]